MATAWQQTQDRGGRFNYGDRRRRRWHDGLPYGHLRRVYLEPIDIAMGSGRQHLLDAGRVEGAQCVRGASRLRRLRNQDSDAEYEPHLHADGLPGDRQASMYRSDNRGATWALLPNYSPVSWDPNDNSIKGFGPYVAIDPANANVVYASTPSSGLRKAWLLCQFSMRSCSSVASGSFARYSRFHRWFGSGVCAIRSTYRIWPSCS